MDIDYTALKGRSDAVVNAIAAERSARNLASRRQRIERGDECAKTRDQLDKKRRDDREADAAGGRIRVRVQQPDRPRYRAGTPRRLYHRQVKAMLKGTIETSDSRGPDRLNSIHYAFTARGFKSSKGRRWRAGEAERAAVYSVREDALEDGERGWWSNIADDRNELVAHYRASEALEKHDRSNANVYISEVIALPAELTARQRRCVVRRICRSFETRGLAYTVGIHLPDASGDQRNYHCHIVFSLRPCRRVAPYEWSFAPGKENDINTPAGIRVRRLAVVRAINATLHATGIDKRYTHLSNKARRMPPPVEGKVGQDTTWARRRLAAMEQRRARLTTWAGMMANVRRALVDGIGKLNAARQNAGSALDDMARAAAAPTGDRRLAVVREHVAKQLVQMRHAVRDSVTNGSGEVNEGRQLVIAQLAQIQAKAVMARDRKSIDGAASHVRGDPAWIGTSTADLTAAGAKRIASAARRIDRTNELHTISVTIKDLTEKGALAVIKARTILEQQLNTMSAAVGPDLSSSVDAARTSVIERLNKMQSAIDSKSPAARRAVARLYTAKPRGGEARRDTAEMAAIRAYITPTKPGRDDDVERTPAAHAVPALEPDDRTIKPAAETLPTGGGHTLARMMAIERERAAREAAWERLVKERAVVTRNGDRYDVDLAALTDVERRLLSRAEFADELQRRLQTLFERSGHPGRGIHAQAAGGSGGGYLPVQAKGPDAGLPIGPSRTRGPER